MSPRPYRLALLLALLAGGAAAAMPSTADLDDSAYTLGLCSRHTGRGPADAVLARFVARNRQTRDARSKTLEAFEQIYRRGQGDGGRVPMESADCQRMVKAVLRRFGG
jgi:hypothetical protein